MNELMNESITTVFVEQPLPLPRSSNYIITFSMEKHSHTQIEASTKVFKVRAQLDQIPLLIFWIKFTHQRVISDNRMPSIHNKSPLKYFKQYRLPCQRHMMIAKRKRISINSYVCSNYFCPILSRLTLLSHTTSFILSKTI